MTPSARTTTTDSLEEQGLSAYERLRLAKIARNEALLESLGLKKKQPILKSISGNQQNNSRSSKKRKRNEKAVTSKERPQRRRRSSPRLKENKSNKDSKAVDSELENAKDWMKRHSFGDDVANNKKRNQKAFKRNRKPIAKKKTPAASAMDDLRDYERDAFFALREWKRARGKELGYTNPCVICHNRTLVEMCRTVPDDEESLLGVWGISLQRLEQHGELMLEALAPWRKQLREGHVKYNQTHENGEYYKAAEGSRKDRSVGSR